MAIEVLRCPNCAAPLPPEARGEVVCAYCNHVLTNVPGAGAARWNGPESLPDDGRPRVHVEGRTYVLQGRVAEGDGCDVFLARRDRRLTELVLLKILRATSDADLLAREWRTLQSLHNSDAQGADYFQRLLPQLVAHGRLTGVGLDPRPTSVFRWRSGFAHTLDDVRRAYPDGVDPRASVWMWKRLLELLGWVHRAGYTHGAVIPSHLILHAKDHGVVLAGWSSAVRNEKLPALSTAAKRFYPDTVWNHRVVTNTTDLIMAARCMAHVLGGDPSTGVVPASVPAPLASLVRTYATLSPDALADDAWEMIERVSQAGREAFGPPRFVPLTLPG
jgi:hypothetical protein